MNTPLQRASIFLVFLQNECPEITPEMLVKALKKLSLNDTADLVQRKMQENATQRPAPQSVPPVSPSSNGPLKEIFRQLSEDEMDTLLEALCPDAWKMLAKALAPDVLNNKLSDTRIKVLEYDNTSPVKSVLSLFRQLQEWPEITPQKFVDGLEQVVSFRVSNIVAKKLGSLSDARHTVYSGVPPELRLLPPVRNSSVPVQTPFKSFMQQFSWQEMKNLVDGLCGEDKWRKLAHIMIPNIQCGKLNPTKVNLIGMHYKTHTRCAKKLLSILQGCPEITPQDFIVGLEKAGVDKEVIANMRARLNSAVSPGIQYLSQSRP